MSDLIINLFLVALGFFLGALTVTLFNNFKQKKQDETPPIPMQPLTNVQNGQEKETIGETPLVEKLPLPGLPDQAAVTTAAATALPGGKPQKGFVAPPPVDMVQEINDVLNEMSLHGDANAGRIKLITDPSLGVSVFVSGQRFGSIAEVVDPQIRQTLQTAVRAWESRRVPGVSK